MPIRTCREKKKQTVKVSEKSVNWKKTNKQTNKNKKNKKNSNNSSSNNTTTNNKRNKAFNYIEDENENKGISNKSNNDNSNNNNNLKAEQSDRFKKKETLIRTRNRSELYMFEKYKRYIENNLKEWLGEKK